MRSQSNPTHLEIVNTPKIGLSSHFLRFTTVTFARHFAETKVLGVTRWAIVFRSAPCSADFCPILL